MAALTTQDVWDAISDEVFAVVGMVNARNEGRTAGIYYLVEDRKLWFATRTSEWKTKHMVANPNVSMTVAIPKRIPFLPFVKIPQPPSPSAGPRRPGRSTRCLPSSTPSSPAASRTPTTQ